ncbi:D-Ala-D-Ala carboxypeptidase family metallohydrolase [uncultured Desulfosarcina sp.]|uniref:D-Ala-D-Ala carboxypeptidase family metallohydrolase n=1 Tax=uncultured Desulfosarcina sp. TaxID=218289 RepID=UPI0029C7A5AD|nr:D-Ala-D-Ala carboxypeptidase family metallohydrolase [uncultured Desulfosarcina sp.]
MKVGQLSEHFFRHEFACKCGCGFDTVDAELIRVLEDLRTEFGDRKIKINSGCRCEAHNQAEGGSSGSMHLQGKATDFRVDGVDADAVADFLENLYPNCYGIGRYNGRTHIDVRLHKARWDKRG